MLIGCYDYELTLQFDPLATMDKPRLTFELSLCQVLPALSRCHRKEGQVGTTSADKLAPSSQRLNRNC